MEKFSTQKHKIISIYRSILEQKPTFYHLHLLKRSAENIDSAVENFLTISQKFGYICLYIFHIIYPTKSIGQMILSQTKIFNIFPSTIQLGNKLKNLTNNCDWETINYIPASDLWINLSLSNESKYSYLTIDCRKSGPAKYRTDADATLNNYGQSKKDRLFNKSLAKKVDHNENLLVFQDSVINVTKNGETKIYKAVQELKNLLKQYNGNQRNSDQPKFSEQPKFVAREHFGVGTKNGRTPRFLI